MALTITSGYKSLNLFITEPANTYYIDDSNTAGTSQLASTSPRSDIDKLYVWVGTADTFTASDNTLVYSGIYQSNITVDRYKDPQNNYVLTELIDNTEYFIRYAITSKLEPDLKIVIPAQNLLATGSFSRNIGSETGLRPWITKTASYTAVAGDRIIADTRGGSFTITLPANPISGESIAITDGWNFAENNLILDRNGKKIVNAQQTGEANNIKLDIQGTTYEFIYKVTALDAFWDFTATTGPKGDEGIDATLLTLEASDKSFIYDSYTSETTDQPSSITFTVNKQNVTGTATFTAKAYDENNFELGNVTLTPGVDENSKILTSTNFVNISGVGKLKIRYVKVTASVISANKTFTDTVTINRIDNGSDAVIHYLTNESHLIPATTLGVVGSYSGASTLGYLSRGTVNETMNWVISKVDGDGLSTTLIQPQKISTSGEITSVTGTGPWTASIVGLSTTTGLAINDTISALETSTGRLASETATSVKITSINAGNKSIVYQVIGGTAPVAGPIGGLAKGLNRYELQTSSLAQNTDAASSTITATKGAVISQKVFSLAKSKAGSVFLILDLSNDNVTVATKNNGSDGDYSLATSTVTALVGTVNVLPSITSIDFTPSTGVTYSVTINGTTYPNFTAALSVQLPYEGQTSINTLSVAITNIANAQDNGKLIVSISYSGNIYSTEFTVTKAKAGPNGEPATIYSLEADSELQYNPNSNTFSPSTIIFTAYTTTGSGLASQFSSNDVKIRLKHSANKTSWTTIGSDQAAATRTLTTSDIPNTARYLQYQLIKFTTVNGVTTETILDSEIDVIGQEGVNASSIIVDIENDTHQIPFDSAGTGDYLYSGTKIQVFENTTELRYVNSSTLTAEQWTIESYTAQGITPSMAVFGLPATSVLPNKYATVDQHSGLQSNTAIITYSIKACTAKGIMVSGLLASQTFTKVLDNAIYRIIGAGTLIKNKSGFTNTVVVKGQKVEAGVSNDFGSLTYQVIPNNNGTESAKSNTSVITIPTLPTISYPSASKHGTAFSWNISGGVANDTWYVQTSGAFSVRVPTTGTNTLNSSGAASFTNGDWSGISGGANNKGTVTLTFYFGSGATAAINHVVYTSSQTAPTISTINKQASINGTGIRVRLYKSTTDTAVLDEATINIAEDGLDAANIVVDVANDTHDIPADSSGTVIAAGYDYSGTIIQVFSNTDQLQYVKRVTGLVLGDNQWTVVSANGSGITPAALPDADSNKYATFGNHSNMTSPTASIDYNIEAKLPDKNLIVGLIGRQTFAKVNRTAIYRIVNTTSISVNKDGTVNQITLNAQKIDGITVTSGFGWITATKDSDQESSTRTQIGTNGYETEALATTKKVTIRLYETASSTTVLDTAQIAVITSGVDGLGSASISYSNDVHIVPITGGASWTSSGGLVRVYEGGDTLSLSGNVRQGIYLGTSGTTTSGSYPSTTGRYNLYIEKVSGDTLTIGNITGEGTTEATLAQWAGTLTQVTSYRITAWVRTLKNQTLKVSTDTKLVPTNDITSYSLVVNPSIVGKAPSANTYTPSSINVKFYKIEGTTTPQLYVASGVEFEINYSTDGSTFADNTKTTISSGANHTNIGTTTGYNYSIPTNVTVQAIRVQAYSGTGASRKLLDEERVSVVPTVKGDNGIAALVKDVTLNIYSGTITKSGTTFSPATIAVISTAHNFTPSEYLWEVTDQAPNNTTTTLNRLSTTTSSSTLLAPGTAISGTITVTVKVYEIINGTRTLIATKQAFFSIVTNGTDGLTGKRVATGYVYYTEPQNTAPAAPSGSTLAYNFNTAQVVGLPNSWSNSAPLFTPSTTDVKYWSASFSAVEGGPGSGTTLATTNPSNPAGTLTFTVQQAIGFSGVVTFTSLSSANSTTIDGSNIKTGYISADRINVGTIDSKISTIGNAQIGNFIKSADFNGTINEAAGTITAVGSTGWAIGKGSANNSGYAVFNNVKVRGDIVCTSLTADRLITTGMVENNAITKTYFSIYYYLGPAWNDPADFTYSASDNSPSFVTYTRLPLGAGYQTIEIAGLPAGESAQIISIVSAAFYPVGPNGVSLAFGPYIYDFATEVHSPMSTIGLTVRGDGVSGTIGGTAVVGNGTYGLYFAGRTQAVGEEKSMSVAISQYTIVLRR